MNFWHLLLILTVSCAQLGSMPTPTPDFDSRYSAYTENKGPGFQFLLIKDGKIIKNASFGLAHLPSATPISYRTRFRLASNTKAFTAAAALLLEQRGLLKPDEKIRTYLPELPAVMKDIKIKHLIHHSSGLPEYDSICEHKETTTKVITNDDVMIWLGKLPKLDFVPGAKFQYSNTGYILLAQVIERVSKASFHSFIKDQIFEPLKMTHSFFFTPKNEMSIKEDRAYGYSSWPWFDSKDRDSCNYTMGDDGIYTSAEDYAKWTKAVSEDDVLFSKDFRKKIFVSDKTADGKLSDYSYGWALIDTAQGPAIGHGGSWVGFRTYARFYPKKNVWIIILSNFVDVPIREVLKNVESEI